MKRTLMLCGIAAAILYTGTVFLGGLLRPGYSHLSMAISELVADGAPNRSLLSSLFVVYNLLVTTFGIGLFVNVNSHPHGRVSGRIGSIALIAVGVAGILMELAFPQEPGGTATTFSGLMHFVLAGVASFGTMVVILMMAFWFKNVPGLKSHVKSSFISVAIIFLSGGMTAAAMANRSSLFGLLERVTIFTFMLWMFMIGRKMAQAEETSHQPIYIEVANSTFKGN